MIHALLALAHGHVRDACNFNPACIVVAPILLWTGVREFKEWIA